MKVPYSWLKDFVDIDGIGADVLGDKLVSAGFEIEEVIDLRESIKNVVVGKVVKMEKHPNSDHMHILKVDVGEKELTQVVCGAPNVRVGLKTAFVKVGGHIDGFEITARPLRGVDSYGMCCSGKELQISDNHEGILELPNEWKNGTHRGNLY